MNSFSICPHNLSLYNTLLYSQLKIYTQPNKIEAYTHVKREKTKIYHIKSHYCIYYTRHTSNAILKSLQNIKTKFKNIDMLCKIYKIPSHHFKYNYNDSINNLRLMSLTLLTPNQPTIEHNYLELLIFCNTLRPYTNTVYTSTALSILMYKDISEEFEEITNSILIVCLLKEQAIYQKLK